MILWRPLGGDPAIDRHLEAISLAVANGDPRLVPVQVQRAYASGATVSQVLTAVEVGRCLADLPAAAIAVAWHAAHAWAWIARRGENPSRAAAPAGVAERQWRSGDRTPGLPAAA